MKATRGQRNECALVVALALLMQVAMGGPATLAQTGTVIASATPSNAAPSSGEQIVVTVQVDMSGVAAPDDELGSYTGSLVWNPAVLTYQTHSGILAGFTGLVNTNQVTTGRIAFTGVNAAGAGGNVAILTITFDVVGAGTSELNLEFTAMSAANSFVNLLPILTARDGQVVVGGGVQEHIYLPCVLKLR